MVNVVFSEKFELRTRKITDALLKTRIKKQIAKIVKYPTIGKPMRFSRKRTREVYVKPYRLAYSFFDDTVIFLDIYHKDEQ